MTRNEFSEWLVRLRDPKNKQWFESYVKPNNNNCRCAIGWIDPVFHYSNIVNLIVKGRHSDFIDQNIDGNRSLFYIITHWNDHDRLTLPQIADKLEAMKATLQFDTR